jgi:hypothetical protein
VGQKKGWLFGGIGAEVGSVDALDDGMDEPVGTGRDGSRGAIDGQVFIGWWVIMIVVVVRMGCGTVHDAVSLTESLGVPRIGISTIATPSGLGMIKCHIMTHMPFLVPTVVTQDTGFITLTRATHPHNIIPFKGMLTHSPRNTPSQLQNSLMRIPRHPLLHLTTILLRIRRDLMLLQDNVGQSLDEMDF